MEMSFGGRMNSSARMTPSTKRITKDWHREGHREGKPVGGLSGSGARHGDSNRGLVRIEK